MNTSMFIKISLGVLALGCTVTPSMTMEPSKIFPKEVKKETKKGTLFFKINVSEANKVKSRLEVPVLFIKSTDGEEYTLMDPTKPQRHEDFVKLCQKYGYNIQNKNFDEIKKIIEGKEVVFINTGRRGLWNASGKTHPIAEIISMEPAREYFISDPTQQKPTRDFRIAPTKSNVKEIVDMLNDAPKTNPSQFKEMGFNEYDIRAAFEEYDRKIRSKQQPTIEPFRSSPSKSLDSSNVKVIVELLNEAPKTDRSQLKQMGFNDIDIRAAFDEYDRKKQNKQQSKIDFRSAPTKSNVKEIVDMLNDAPKTNPSQLKEMGFNEYDIRAAFDEYNKKIHSKQQSAREFPRSTQTKSPDSNNVKVIIDMLNEDPNLNRSKLKNMGFSDSDIKDAFEKQG